ncbi:hypothetical protein BGZ93_009758 [Podila epicladia]|nr:hypothetical protein BGZ92_003882 [Podila epicladia]KAG0098965.1 hypothetical protein BGZ93_009758 [Podila epicladia]
MAALTDHPDTEVRLDTSTAERQAAQQSSPSEWTESISALSPAPNTHMQHTELFIRDITTPTPAQQQQQRQLVQQLQQRQAMSDDAITRHTDTSQARSTSVSANEINIIENITSPAPTETSQIYLSSAAASSTASTSRSNVAVAMESYLDDACLEELFGPTARSEEDLALQVGLELAARRKQSIQQSTQTGAGSSSGMSSGSSERDQEGNDVDKDTLEYHYHLDDEEKDHCLSGICLPRSQCFQTSVICSNTMTRDGLANERTLLSWLNVSMSLCLVSLSFMTRAFTFDTIADDVQDNRPSGHKDRLSRWIGYVCFGCAFFAAIYSLLKYLRNIRRISTRYPFAQAGKWTFTVGMVLGVLIMVALTIAYTENI